MSANRKDEGVMSIEMGLKSTEKKGKEIISGIQKREEKTVNIETRTVELG